MKKTMIKRTIAAALAVTTLAGSAVLFTGCGKSDEEKAKDAFAAFMSDTESDLREFSKAKGATQPTTKPKEKVDLKDFRKAVFENNTVAFDGDEQNDSPQPYFYLKVNSPLEVNGYTYTQKGEDKRSSYKGSVSEWEIAKNGVKYAELILTTKWMGLEKPNTFQLQAKVSGSAGYTDECDATFLGTDINNFDINIPAALTEEECKKNVAALEKLLSDKTPKGDYKDKDLKLEGIYYFKGNPGEECARAVYSYNYWGGIDSKTEWKWGPVCGCNLSLYGWQRSKSR